MSLVIEKYLYYVNYIIIKIILKKKILILKKVLSHNKSEKF